MRRHQRFATTLDTDAPLKPTVPRFSMLSVGFVLDVERMYVVSPSFGSSSTHFHSFASLSHAPAPPVPDTVHDTTSPFAFGRSFDGDAGAVFTSRYEQRALSDDWRSVHREPQFPPVCVAFTRVCEDGR
jgi:hypothetical protein